MSEEYICTQTPIGKRILLDGSVTETTLMIEDDIYRNFTYSQNTGWWSIIPTSISFIISSRHHEYMNTSLEFLRIVNNVIYRVHVSQLGLLNNELYDDIKNFLQDNFRGDCNVISDFLTGNDHLITFETTGDINLPYNSKADCFEEISYANSDELYTYKFQVMTSIFLLNYDYKYNASIKRILEKIIEIIFSYINKSDDADKYYSRLLDINYIDDDRNYYRYVCRGYCLLSSFMYICQEYTRVNILLSSLTYISYSQEKIYYMLHIFDIVIDNILGGVETVFNNDISIDITKEYIINNFPGIDLLSKITCVTQDNAFSNEIIPIYTNSLYCRPTCITNIPDDNEIFHKSKLVEIPIILIVIEILFKSFNIIENIHRKNKEISNLLLVFADICHDIQFPQEKIDQYIS